MSIEAYEKEMVIKDYEKEAIADFGGFDAILKTINSAVVDTLIAKKLSKKKIEFIETHNGMKCGRIAEIINGSPISMNEFGDLKGPLRLEWEKIFENTVISDEATERWSHLSPEKQREILRDLYFGRLFSMDGFNVLNRVPIEMVQYIVIRVFERMSLFELFTI